MNTPTKVVVTGASGFIGRHLLNELTNTTASFEVSALSRSGKQLAIESTDRFRLVKGDLLQPDTLTDLVQPGSIVVNLVYISEKGDAANLNAVDNLIEQCMDKGVRRLVHCSTAVVSGGVNETEIDENTDILPVTDYEKLKFEIENRILATPDNFEKVILRPTAVFGKGGSNLMKLMNDLVHGSSFKNYLRSCLYHKRCMNLVCVENVVTALMVLINADSLPDKEVYLVSEDDNENNNFRFVEQFLRKKLQARNLSFPRLPIPASLFSIVAKIAGQPIAPPKRVYSAQKLSRLGWQKKISFEEGLARFADWYQKNYIGNNGRI